MKDFKTTILVSTISKMMQHSATLTDILETLLYTLCVSFRGIGGFISLDGRIEYFDVVVGSYRSKRLGARGGPKMWEYELPDSGKLVFTNNVWLYKSGITGWLIGIETEHRPDIDFIETLNLLAMNAGGFIERNEEKVEGIDPLTGVFNRERFFQDARHLVDVFSRNSSKPLWLIFVDLNNFKAVNDTLGHRVGDRVLQSQASIVRRAVGSHGAVYRYGGDEFCVLLPGISKEKAFKIARRIELDSEQAPGGILVSASTGVVLYNPGEGINNFVSRADEEMYNRKKDLKEEA